MSILEICEPSSIIYNYCDGKLIYFAWVPLLSRRSSFESSNILLPWFPIDVVFEIFRWLFLFRVFIFPQAWPREFSPRFCFYLFYSMFRSCDTFFITPFNTHHFQAFILFSPKHIWSGCWIQQNINATHTYYYFLFNNK